MAPMSRLPSLRRPPIGFAHRGARAHAPENTLEAFALALRLGATGLESDVWLTADGVPVLDHDGLVGPRLRRQPIGRILRADLPPALPALAELLGELGSDYELSLDVKDPAAGAVVVQEVLAHDPAMAARLWLCHDDLDLLESWRAAGPAVRLVASTRLRALRQGPERRAATLQGRGIDALNLHHSDWTGGLTTLCHRFGILTFGWDAQFPRVLDGLLEMGIDAVYSDHVDRMVESLGRHAALPHPKLP
ncbi:MAG: putative phosphodiesterase [Acidimicrobiales bacterium]|nr:putative phosphodiesterase [Acidimicrobiales bacterium]